MSETNGFVTVNEAAKACGTTPAVIYTSIRHGRIPTHRNGIMRVDLKAMREYRAQVEERAKKTKRKPERTARRNYIEEALTKAREAVAEAKTKREPHTVIVPAEQWEWVEHICTQYDTTPDVVLLKAIAYGLNAFQIDALEMWRRR